MKVSWDAPAVGRLIVDNEEAASLQKHVRNVFSAIVEAAGAASAEKSASAREVIGRSLAEKIYRLSLTFDQEPRADSSRTDAEAAFFALRDVYDDVVEMLNAMRNLGASFVPAAVAASGQSAQNVAQQAEIIVRTFLNRTAITSNVSFDESLRPLKDEPNLAALDLRRFRALRRAAAKLVAPTSALNILLRELRGQARDAGEPVSVADDADLYEFVFAVARLAILRNFFEGEAVVPVALLDAIDRGKKIGDELSALLVIQQGAQSPAEPGDDDSVVVVEPKRPRREDDVRPVPVVTVEPVRPSPVKPVQPVQPSPVNPVQPSPVVSPDSSAPVTEADILAVNIPPKVQEQVGSIDAGSALTFDADLDWTRVEKAGVAALGESADLTEFVTGASAITRKVAAMFGLGAAVDDIENEILAYANEYGRVKGRPVYADEEDVQSFEGNVSYTSAMAATLATALLYGMLDDYAKLSDNKLVRSVLRLADPQFTVRVVSLIKSLAKKGDITSQAQKEFSALYEETAEGTTDLSSELGQYSDILEGDMDGENDVNFAIATNDFHGRLMVLRVNGFGGPLGHQWAAYARSAADKFVTAIVNIARESGEDGRLAYAFDADPDDGDNVGIAEIIENLERIRVRDGE